jgi:hypothetical protein
VPFDVAWALNDTELMAYYVAMGESEGGTFDWDGGGWMPP